MPRYCVDVYSTVRHRFFVEADDEAEAEDKAKDEWNRADSNELALCCKDWEFEQAFVDKMEE